MERVAVWSISSILAVVGATLLAGGVALILDSGSAYYLAAGLAVLASAVALVRRSSYAVIIYAGLLIGTLLWSLWEVGLDGWALAPRLLGPAVVGLLFLLPPIRRHSGAAAWWWIVGPVLAIVAVIAAPAVMSAMSEPAAQPVAAAASSPPAGPTEWRNWGNTVGGTRYAPISQIDTHNVAQLQLAWRYDLGVPPQPVPSFEATPLAADGRLYVCLQPGIVAAIDPDTGHEIWRYTSPAYKDIDFTKVFGGKCRGVSYFEAPHAVTDCPKRVLFSSPDGFLVAVDATTGQPCPSFGEAGAVDIKTGMGPLPARTIIALPTSPPTIVNGVAVIGQTISDLGSLNSPSGVIRGYDAVTGALRWAWDAGRPDEPLLQPGETYTRDTPNAWGVFSGDEQLGLVFVPTGGGPPDYFGGMRPKVTDRYTDSIVAIDVATGKERWSFQTVHHDLWDFDVAAQPVAVDIPGPGGVTPALLAPTKTGQIFVLDRRTGQPINSVVERPVPQGAAPGDWTSATQPFTTGFPSFSGPDLKEADMWGITPLDQLWCRLRFRESRYEGKFTPIGTGRDTIMYPGTAGGINWGSVAVDPARGLVFVNTLHFASFGRLIPRAEAPASGFGGKAGVVIFGMARNALRFRAIPLHVAPRRTLCAPALRDGQCPGSEDTQAPLERALRAARRRDRVVGSPVSCQLGWACPTWAARS